MITEPDPTPEQLRKYQRSARNSALLSGIVSALYLLIGILYLTRGRDDQLFGWAWIGLGVLGFFATRVQWSRLRKYLRAVDSRQCR